MRSPLTAFPIFHLGGAVGRVGDDETAFNGRTAGHTFNINATTATRDGFEEEREWSRSFWSALQPHHTGVYVNFLMDEGRAADPRRLRHQQVRPAAGAETQVRPGQLLPPQPEHPTRLGSAAGRRAMRRDIEFDAEGVTLRGWLYVPDGASGPVPTVVMAHGFSAVKEMYLDSFAEAFAAGGWGRWCSTTGTSAPATASRARRSTPGRRCATTAMRSPGPRPSPRSTPTGSGCGGPATAAAMCWSLGAIDKRIKCVAAQVPLVSGFRQHPARWSARTSWAPNRAPWTQDRAGPLPG